MGFETATLPGNLAGMAELNFFQINNLRRQLAGQVLLPGDIDYDTARQVWNAAIDRCPAVIVRPTHEADVQVAVRFAAERGLPICVRGGAHHHAGYAVADGAVMLDLSAWRTVRVDPTEGTVTAAAGARWADVDTATAEFGLATTGADVPVVGVSGHVLGGGFGWLHRRFGLACDNLLSVRMITAGGEIKIIDGERNWELYWALRGGGGAFGVVTELTLRLHPVEGVHTADALLPLDRARKALDAYREITWSAPDQLFVRAMIAPAPAAPFVPESLRGRPVLMLAGAWIGNPDKAAAGLQPITALGGAAAQPSSYLTVQRMAQEAFPGRVRAAASSHFVNGPSDALLDALVDAASDAKGLTMLSLQPNGGAMARIRTDATAFPHRQPSHHLHIQGMAAPDDDSTQYVDWVSAVDDRVRPEVTEACYGNVATPAPGFDLAAAAYGINLPRLRAIKITIDPANLFRFTALSAPAPSDRDQSAAQGVLQMY